MEHYIEFPALGWKFGISPDIFTIGSFTIRWYGVLIALGFLLAMIYGLKRAKYFHIDPDRMIDVVLVSTIFAFIGARLYYVLFSSERAEYFADPIRIFKVWEGGLAIYGGIILAFITAIWMCRVRKVDTLRMFDIASLGFLIGQGIGRWGNFFNQEAFGGNTTLPWGMTGDIIQSGVNGSGYTLTDPVHPTFLYESLWCLLGLLVLHIVSKKLYRFKGEIFALYIMWYGAGRFVIEGLRTDSLTMVPGSELRVSQLVAALSVVGGLVLLFVFKFMAERSPKDLFAEETAPPSADGESVAEEGAEQPVQETGAFTTLDVEDMTAQDEEILSEESQTAVQAAMDEQSQEISAEDPFTGLPEDETDPDEKSASQESSERG